MRSIYVSSDLYERLISTIRRFSPRVSEETIMIDLGEFGEIWPEYVRDDLLVNESKHAAHRSGAPGTAPSSRDTRLV